MEANTQLDRKWKQCEAILESYLQGNGCFLTLEEVKDILLSSGFAKDKDSLNNVLLALNMLSNRRYTVYDVERAALLLANKHKQEDVFKILVETLDPESTGVIYINQLKCLLGKFGASMTDIKWNYLQDTYAPGGDGKFTYEQFSSILKTCENPKNHESGSN